jgi:hypothetical protein
MTYPRRRSIRRGVCPCGDVRIEDPGPKTPFLSTLNQGCLS